MSCSGKLRGPWSGVRWPGDSHTRWGCAPRRGLCTNWVVSLRTAAWCAWPLMTGVHVPAAHAHMHTRAHMHARTLLLPLVPLLTSLHSYWIFLKHSRSPPAPGPLHLLFLLPGMLPPAVSAPSPPSDHGAGTTFWVSSSRTTPLRIAPLLHDILDSLLLFYYPPDTYQYPTHLICYLLIYSLSPSLT